MKFAPKIGPKASTPAIPSSSAVSVVNTVPTAKNLKLPQKTMESEKHEQSLVSHSMNDVEDEFDSAPTLYPSAVASRELSPVIETQSLFTSVSFPVSEVPQISRLPRTNEPPKIQRVTVEESPQPSAHDLDPFDDSILPTNDPISDTQKEIASSKRKTDEDGNIVYDVPLLTIQELIDVTFTQGKTSTLYETLLKEKEKKRARKKQKEAVQEEEVEQENATPVAPTPTEALPPPTTGGPKLRIVDGKIEIDQDSLFVNAEQPETQAQNLEVVEESTTKYITSNSFRKRASQVKWSQSHTAMFYQGLSYFGSDLSLITLFINSQETDDIHSMFKVTRKQIKLKFDQEERNRGHLVSLALLSKKTPTSDIWERMKQYVRDHRPKESQVESSIETQQTITPLMGNLDEQFDKLDDENTQV